MKSATPENLATQCAGLEFEPLVHKTVVNLLTRASELERYKCVVRVRSFTQQAPLGYDEDVTEYVIKPQSESQVRCRLRSLRDAPSKAPAESRVKGRGLGYVKSTRIRRAREAAEHSSRLEQACLRIQKLQRGHTARRQVLRIKTDKWDLS